MPKNFLLGNLKHLELMNVIGGNVKLAPSAQIKGSRILRDVQIGGRRSNLNTSKFNKRLK